MLIIKKGNICFLEALKQTDKGAERIIKTAVIVSSEKINNSDFPYVFMCYVVEKSYYDNGFNIKTNSCKKPSFILCDEIHRIAKNRLIDCIGVCTNKEIRKIDTALSEIFAIKSSLLNLNNLNDLNVLDNLYDSDDFEKKVIELREKNIKLEEKSTEFESQLNIYKTLYLSLLDEMNSGKERLFFKKKRK